MRILAERTITHRQYLHEMEERYGSYESFRRTARKDSERWLIAGSP